MSRARRRRENRKTANINPKREQQKQKRKRCPRVPSDQLRAIWNNGMTTRRNIEGAGLLLDANKLDESEPKIERKLREKPTVVDLIEAEANQPRRDRSFVMKDDMKFLAMMISKHGMDEWSEMSRDPENVYQLTPKQIKRIFMKCQKVPVAYNALMIACGLKEVPEGLSHDMEVEGSS
ncbi:nucleolar protein 16 [Galendromus occidentalis]|uniref:Nucleolar protein 16 n=1 Tax=Galendromus occidentalis TaxID=34638 RepID=A0AAJ6QXD4_9ACAR|nr:nucleolar protein 16 [Galendromus occidentalis]